MSPNTERKYFAEIEDVYPLLKLDGTAREYITSIIEEVVRDTPITPRDLVSLHEEVKNFRPEVKFQSRTIQREMNRMTADGLFTLLHDTTDPKGLEYVWTASISQSTEEKKNPEYFYEDPDFIQMPEIPVLAITVIQSIFNVFKTLLPKRSRDK